MAEQGAHNALVVGSNPAEPTLMIFKNLKDQSLLAFKTRDSRRREVLNFIISEIQNEAMKTEGEDKSAPSDELVLRMLNKTVKTRKDNISSYKKLGRDELVLEEEYELDIVTEFLPAQLTEAEIAKEIEQVKLQNPDLSGIKLMPILSQKLKGMVDMSVVKKLLSE